MAPGQETEVPNWDQIKEHQHVKKLLDAGMIEVVGDDAEGDESLSTLRAEYQSLYGKRAYHGWSAEELQEKIDAKLAE